MEIFVFLSLLLSVVALIVSLSPKQEEKVSYNLNAEILESKIRQIEKTWGKLLEVLAVTKALQNRIERIEEKIKKNKKDIIDVTVFD